MVEVIAKLKYLRIAPRKVRLVASSIRKESYVKARRHLSFLPKRASIPIKKLLESAGANAKNNFNLNAETLYVKKITVDEGPVFKRYMPRAMGRATIIRKKSSHITLVLDEVQNQIKQKVKDKKL
ncbi:MAG: 50S ribosomal protein L22 [Candidatus Niyogibacteria bacterium]|nr:50S ribosomal protein L22 [Candidatus Niyogibacteria bacterium]